MRTESASSRFSRAHFLERRRVIQPFSFMRCRVSVSRRSASAVSEARTVGPVSCGSGERAFSTGTMAAKAAGLSRAISRHASASAGVIFSPRTQPSMICASAANRRRLPPVLLGALRFRPQANQFRLQSGKPRLLVGLHFAVRPFASQGSRRCEQYPPRPSEYPAQAPRSWMARRADGPRSHARERPRAETAS